MLSVTGDNYSTQVINQSAAGSASYTAASWGNLRLLVVGVIAITSDPTSITYGGAAMTKIGAVSGPGTTLVVRTSLWVLQNPKNGSNTLTVTWSGTWSARLVIRSYFNVHAYNCLSAVQAYSGDTLTTTLTFPESQNQGYSFHVGGFGVNATRTIGAGEYTLFNN